MHFLADFDDEDNVPIDSIDQIEEKNQTHNRGLILENCQQCNKEFHHPCSCEMVREWFDNDKNSLETLKSCPLCGHSIEKDTGSDQLICNKCEHEFCFVCTKTWDGHGHCVSCEPNTDALQHYMKIYNAHDLSQKLTEKTLSYGMAHELKIVTNSLIVCHQLLKYCSIYAYMQSITEKQFFYAWRNLEREIQDLHNTMNSFVIDFDEIQRLHLSAIAQYKAVLKYGG